MSLFLVRVTEKSPMVTVPVAVKTREYEVEAVNLTAACLRVVNAPVRPKGPGYVQRMDSDPYTHRYVEPDKARYAAISISFPQGDIAAIEKVVSYAGLDPEKERLELARALGRADARAAEANLLDMMATESGWETATPQENAASLRRYVENDWYDEEVEGRSWFHELQTQLATTGILAEPIFLDAAKDAYWEEVVAIAGELKTAQPAPAP